MGKGWDKMSGMTFGNITWDIESHIKGLKHCFCRQQVAHKYLLAEIKAW